MSPLSDPAPAAPAARPHVRIVMATRDGMPFLRDQLDSFVAQDHADWSLTVGDDGSGDGTRALLEAFRADHPGRRIEILPGPRRGAAANFLATLGAAGDLPPGAAVALSDQDDVWLPDRLSRALTRIGPDGGARGTAYCSRTWIGDRAARPLRPSRRHRGGLCFGNALVQNVMAGNTMVFDAAATRILRGAVPDALAVRGGRGVAHHDWWIYAFLAGAGTRLIGDDRPGLIYRQHGHNEMGASGGLGHARDRIAMLADGRYADWLDGNLEALARRADDLTPEARALLERVVEWRAGAGRWTGGLRRAGMRRQSRGGDVLLALAAAAGWLRPRGQMPVAPRRGA